MTERKVKSHFNRFLLLWSGQLISAIGGGLTSFGLGVYVFNRTGSAAGMALVTLLAFLPTLILSVPAGVLADRYDRRLLMMLGDGLSAVGILYILICMLRGGAELYQICIGVFISSVFSSLLEPAYRATVTDLLTKEEYSKASGMVSIAGSARYLISPLLAGLLLAVSDIKLLLIIDICTFFFTVITTGIVKRGLEAKAAEVRESFAASFREGWKVVTQKRGVITLPKIDSAEMMFSASRSRRLQIVPIIQSFAQLEQNYGKEGADVIIDNTQLTIFGGFAPNSTSAEVLSKALGSRTVMSGSVSRSKNDPSQSLQMIERPLMTPDELKSLPKGTFVVMKTGFYPMKVKLKLFFKWGINFEEKYQVAENGNRKVEYASRAEIINSIIKIYHPELMEKPAPETNDVDDENNSGKEQNSNIRTSPNSDIESTDDLSESKYKKKAVLKTEAKHNEQT